MRSLALLARGELALGVVLVAAVTAALCEAPLDTPASADLLLTYGLTQHWPTPNNNNMNTNKQQDVDEDGQELDAQNRDDDDVGVAQNWAPLGTVDSSSNSDDSSSMIVVAGDGEERDVDSNSGKADVSKRSASVSSAPSVEEQFVRASRQLAAGNMFVHRARQYDVPQIECPPAEDGFDRFACPSPDRLSRYKCIDAHALCDGFIDCPHAEDEDRMACMFYKTTKAHLDVLADALLRWARGR